MKKKLLFFSLFTINVLMAQVPSYVPTNGLVGYWPFNGNANDASGSGNNGVVTGATLTADRAQNSNSCYNFNVNNWSWGSGGDEIYIPFNNSFNSTNITVSSWFMKTSNGTQNQGLTIIKRFEYGYSNPNGQTWGVDLDYGSNPFMRTFILQASAQNNQQNILVMGSQIALNTWYNVVFSFDGQNLKQYINGVLFSSNNLSGFSLNTNGNSGISIGVSDQANGHWSPFDGKIDDIGIWNRALTQAEITGLYTTLGTTQTEAVNQIAIYPNPAKDQITIDCGNISSISGWSYTIVNTLGQEVSKGVMNSQQNVVSLNTLNGTGLYLVKIFDAESNLINTKKIIKE